MFADMAPPPTFLIDSYVLGSPLGFVAALVFLTVAFLTFRVLRRWGLGKWKAGIITLFVYAACNFGVYLYGLGESQNRNKEIRDRVRNEFRERQRREAEEKEKASKLESSTPTPTPEPMVK